jgi:hypothetical protein
MLFHAACAQFIPRAFGPGAAESRPVGIGLFGRLGTLAALLESFQVDNVPHVFPPSSRKGNTSDFGTSAVASGVSLFKSHRKKSRWSRIDSIKKFISLCEIKNYLCCTTLMHNSKSR